ncbi:MAG: hypothetical protein JNM88_12355 [Chitinophagaceae bacterium]|nr:hypothetical protein [Chitinophagaceae bacterium]
MRFLTITLLLYLPGIIYPEICSGQPKEAANPRLSVEIQAIWKEYNSALLANIKIEIKNECPQEYSALNTRILQLLDSVQYKFGYPDHDMVGVNVSGEFDKILFNYPLAAERKQAILQKMREKVLQQKASADNYAKITDRLMYNKSKSQVYGTIVSASNIYPDIAEKDLILSVPGLVDETNTDNKRKEIGLKPLADYLAQFRKDLALSLSSAKKAD